MTVSRMRLTRSASSDAGWTAANAMLRSVLGYDAASEAVAAEDDPMPFLVRVTRDIDDPALTRDWARLEADGRASVFQSHEWQRGLVRHLVAADTEPLFVTVCASDDGQPLALFPLQRARDGGLTIIEYLAPGFCDTAMPLLAAGFSPSPDEMEAMLTAIVAALPPADRLRLAKLPRDLYGVPNPLAGLSGCRASPDMTFPVVLTPEAPGFVGATSAYKAYQKQWRKLTRRDGIAFEIFEDQADIARAFDAMIAMRNTRFDALHRDDLLDDPAVAAFYRDMALQPKAERVVSIAGLKVGDEYTAYIYMMDHAGKLSTVISAIDNSVGNAYAPGLILFTKIFERAVECGYAAADIGIGYMHYKTRFAPTPSHLLVLDRGLTLKGKAVVALATAERGLKTWARGSKTVRALAEKVLKRKIAGPLAQAAPEDD